jgi:ketosteroid isomerase-like protein
MSDLQAIVDRVEIEALRGEFTDAVMMRDYDRLASLFTEDGVVRMPHINEEAVTGRRSAPESSGYRVSWTASCKPRTRATSSSRATPRPAAHTSQSSCASATAGRS